MITLHNDNVKLGNKNLYSVVRVMNNYIIEKWVGKHSVMLYDTKFESKTDALLCALLRAKNDHT